MAKINRTSGFNNWLQQHEQAGFRAVLQLAGSEAWCKKQAEQLCRDAGVEQPLLLGWGDVMESLARCRKLLGTDQQAIVLNAHRGLNPNLLGVCSGTLIAGGLLILLTPPADEWPNFDDPDYQRMQVAGEERGFAGCFLQHVVTVLDAESAVVCWQQDQACSWPEVNYPAAGQRVFEQQQLVIEQICRVATGHARRPLVIEADRGRGKSAALGLAAARLMAEKSLTIVLTAAHISSVETVFTHVQLELERQGIAVERQDNCIAAADSQLLFFAPDALINAKPSANLLLVDEAAMIPVSLLQPMLQIYNRLVFATTVHGYEGNGRGFSLRFSRHLDAVMPQWRRAELTQPIRWADGDPLERLTDDLLLLQAEPAALDDEYTGDQLQFEAVTPQQLLCDSELLKQLFGLLVIAHYQTTPDDLRLLLDHPDVMIDIAVTGKTVVGVCLSMKEGAFDAATQQLLQSSARRLRGHLLPQALFSSGCDAALSQGFQRVMRIAVHPQLQRQGIGRQLLNHVEAQSEADFLGASFSSEAAVLAFWQSAGFQPVRLGSHKEAATGEYACVVLRPCTDRASRLFAELRQQFAADLPWQLLTQNRDIHPALLPLLIHGLAYPVSTTDRAQCQRYVVQQSGFETVLPALQRSLLAITSQRQLSEDDDLLLLEAVLCNRHWSLLAENYKLSGRKNIEQRMRQRLQHWLTEDV